tara:strand:+ start:304 stop:801 length:498 start_codon:yes stop_codon:yes gene_type:complete
MKSAIFVLLVVALSIVMSARVIFDPLGVTVILALVAMGLQCVAGVVIPLTKGSYLKVGLIYAVGTAMIVLVAVTQFPLRMTFALSETALQRLAAEVVEQGPLTEPAQAGLFTIAKASVHPNGSVFLMTDPDPSGPAGFVYQYTGSGYNIWSEYRIDDSWHFIALD